MIGLFLMIFVVAGGLTIDASVEAEKRELRQKQEKSQNGPGVKK